MSPNEMELVIATLQERVVSLESTLRGRDVARRRQTKVAISFLGASLALVAGAAIAVTVGGVNLYSIMDFSATVPTLPSLNTSVRWTRTDPAGVEPGHTNEILSLVAEATQTNSFTWPLFIQLTGTNSPDAKLETSQSTGANVRSFQRSTGSPWMAGYHGELFHGLDSLGGSTIATNGTSILYNGELTSMTSTGSTIGLNILNTKKSAVPGTHAIQIQPGSKGWNNGIHFGSGATGNIGINFDAATYNMGIDLGANSLRLNGNQKIILEKTGQVFLRYNTTNGMVEIVKGGNVVAAW